MVMYMQELLKWRRMRRNDCPLPWFSGRNTTEPADILLKVRKIYISVEKKLISWWHARTFLLWRNWFYRLWKRVVKMMLCHPMGWRSFWMRWLSLIWKQKRMTVPIFMLLFTVRMRLWRVSVSVLVSAPCFLYWTVDELLTWSLSRPASSLPLPQSIKSMHLARKTMWRDVCWW